MDGNVLLGLNEVPSLNQVLRALKREEASLYNCVASICDDAIFVQQVTALYPSLPLFPNLRCGVWYVRPPIADTCYFKSTDGHNGNWSFSTIRLNLNLAQAAAAAGGCLIVDATKRGKRFPDAMSKTVPIWAAVMNRAVQRLRQGGHAVANGEALRTCSTPNLEAGHAPAAGNVQDGQQAPVAASVQAAAPGSAGGEQPCSCSDVQAEDKQPWDCDVHLPAWVSANEAHSIRLRLEGWADSLLEVGADLSSLSAALRKPLRCMWVSQDSPISPDSVANAASLPFTPIILVGASATNSRQRRCLTLQPDLQGGSQGGEESLSITYSYLPGAADDEESWACGLTPALLWSNVRSLLAAGPGGIEARVRQLLEEQQQQQLQGRHDQQQRQQEEQQQHKQQWRQGHNSAAAQGALLPGEDLQAGNRPAAGELALPGDTCDSTIHSTVAPGRDAARPLHDLLPQGCLPAQAAAVQMLGSGIYLLGSTGLAISSAAAAAAPAVWQYADAVLHLGAASLAGMQREPQPASPEEQHEQKEQAEQIAGGKPDGSNGVGKGPEAVLVPPCRYCWLPVRSSKLERHSLQQELPAALRFAQQQLRSGRRLLVCCDSGLDASVCVVVACLLAFFHLDQHARGGSRLSPAFESPTEGMGAYASDSSSHLDISCVPDLPPPLLPVVGPHCFSKLTVRQHLAAVSTYYPAARPTRASLRQLFNFFLQQLGSSQAPAGSGEEV